MNASTPRPTIPGMRLMLYVASALVFAVGIPLLLLTEHTDTYFAWTIASPLTAAFLGGSYWASCVLEFLAAREPIWARSRIAVPAVLVFTALTLVVTLLHLDKFHFASTNLLTLSGTWVWLAVYALVPIVLAILLLRQLQTSGGDPLRTQPLPLWMRAILGFNGTIMVILGCALLIVPLNVAALWPWALTALTGRAIGAWLIGLGISALQAVWENDLSRTRTMLISALVFAALQFLALIRYGGEFQWSSVSGWLYLLIMADLLVIGAYGWLASRRGLRQAATATV